MKVIPERAPSTPVPGGAGLSTPGTSKTTGTTVDSHLVVFSTTSTTASAPVKPMKPTMGDIVQTTQGYVAVTGGKPLRSWSGLVDPADSSSKVTNSLFHCAQGGNSQLKGQELRETMLSKVLKYDSDLALFADLLSKKLVDNGMDTIAYIPDPFNMSYILTEFAKFPEDDKVPQQVEKVKGSYDQHDKDNNMSAINLLYNSVDPAFADRIRSRCR
jgi:hypothetical protein